MASTAPPPLGASGGRENGDLGSRAAQMGARDQNAAPGLPDNVAAAEKSPPTAPIVSPLPLSVLNGFTWPEPPERIDWTADAEGSGRTLTLQLAERIGYNPADIELLLLFTGSSPVEAGSSNGGSGKNHTQKDGEELRRITDEETLATQGVPSGATVRIVRRHRTMPACARDAFGVVPGASRGVSASFLEQLREHRFTLETAKEDFKRPVLLRVLQMRHGVLPRFAAQGLLDACSTAQPVDHLLERLGAVGRQAYGQLTDRRAESVAAAAMDAAAEAAAKADPAAAAALAAAKATKRANAAKERALQAAEAVALAKEAAAAAAAESAEAAKAAEAEEAEASLAGVAEFLDVSERGRAPTDETALLQSSSSNASSSPTQAGSADTDEALSESATDDTHSAAAETPDANDAAVTSVSPPPVVDAESLDSNAETALDAESNAIAEAEAAEAAAVEAAEAAEQEAAVAIAAATAAAAKTASPAGEPSTVATSVPPERTCVAVREAAAAAARSAAIDQEEERREEEEARVRRETEQLSLIATTTAVERQNSIEGGRKAPAGKGRGKGGCSQVGGGKRGKRPATSELPMMDDMAIAFGCEDDMMDDALGGLYFKELFPPLQGGHGTTAPGAGGARAEQSGTFDDIFDFFFDQMGDEQDVLPAPPPAKKQRSRKPAAKLADEQPAKPTASRAPAKAPAKGASKGAAKSTRPSRAKSARATSDAGADAAADSSLTLRAGIERRATTDSVRSGSSTSRSSSPLTHIYTSSVPSPVAVPAAPPPSMLAPSPLVDGPSPKGRRRRGSAAEGSSPNGKRPRVSARQPARKGQKTVAADGPSEPMGPPVEVLDEPPTDAFGLPPSLGFSPALGPALSPSIPGMRRNGSLSGLVNLDVLTDSDLISIDCPGLTQALGPMAL